MCRQSATVCLIKSPSRQHRAIADLPTGRRPCPTRVTGVAGVTRS
jgi:hypothetical protein